AGGVGAGAGARLRGPGRQGRGECLRGRPHDAVVEGQAEGLDVRGGPLAAEDRRGAVARAEDEVTWRSPRRSASREKRPTPRSSRWSFGSAVASTTRLC